MNAEPVFGYHPRGPDPRYLPHDASEAQIAEARRMVVRVVDLLKASARRGTCSPHRLKLALGAIGWRLNNLFGDRHVKDWEAWNLSRAEHLLCELECKVIDAIRAGWRGFPKLLPIFY